MLSKKQIRFKNDFLSPIKQKLYFAKNLPMGLISGIKLTELDEGRAVSEVTFRWLNKNPFNSIYFAVLSMAAELSTAAPTMLALKAVDADIALIIVDLRAEFVKKAQTTISFTCLEYDEIDQAIRLLNKPGDTGSVTVKTVGRDVSGEEVATFYFTWSFKRRA